MNEKLTYTSTAPQAGEVCGYEPCNNVATEAFRGGYGEHCAAGAIPTCAEHARRLIGALFGGRELIEQQIQWEVDQLWQASGLDDETRRQFDRIWQSAAHDGQGDR
ncbi:MAG: hypothetical protein M3Y90_15180 [Actinomycetota bacterium]|nr:hypothetical protein [Actinomycetota bacterium]